MGCSLQHKIWWWLALIAATQINQNHRSLDSFTVPLNSPNGRHLPAVRAVQRDCNWGLKNGGNSHKSHEPIMQWGTRQSQSIFRPVTKGWCQPIGGHVSHPTDSPITARLGLCSSLIDPCPHVYFMGLCYHGNLATNTLSLCFLCRIVEVYSRRLQGESLLAWLYDVMGHGVLISLVSTKLCRYGFKCLMVFVCLVTPKLLQKGPIDMKSALAQNRQQALTWPNVVTTF